MSLFTMNAALAVFALVAVLQVAAIYESSSREHGRKGNPHKNKQCRLACPHGQVLDKSRCRCLTPFLNIVNVQCPPVVCPKSCSSGAVVKKDNNGCKACTCVRQKVCQPVLCRMGCPNGWAKNQDGCDVCRCKEPSRLKQCPLACNIDCPYGMVLSENGCPTCTCKANPNKAISNGKCGAVCMIYCPHGNVLDINGCPTCKCNPNPGMLGS